MDVIYGLIPSMVIIGLIFFVVLFWSAKSGQYDDLEGESFRILMDEDIVPDDNEKVNNEAEGAPREDG